MANRSNGHLEYSEFSPLSVPGCSSAHVRRLFRHTGVAVMGGASVHHVAVMIGLHRLLRVTLASHHAHLHLHRVLGRLIHVSGVAVVTTVHHRLWHPVARRHGVQWRHVHGIVRRRRRHEVWHHAALHCQGARSALHGHSARAAAVELLLVRGGGELLGGFGADGNVAFDRGHLTL